MSNICRIGFYRLHKTRKAKIKLHVKHSVQGPSRRGGREEPFLRGGGEEVPWRGTPGEVTAEETGEEEREGDRGSSQNLGGGRLEMVAGMYSGL